MDYVIRSSTQSDIPHITDIYNHAILNTTATFDTEPKSVNERTEWYREHGASYPVIVAESDGQVVGYASLSRYSTKQAYAKTAELSVYVHHAHRGKGIGKRLTEEILTEGRKAGLHAVLSRIAGDNEVSIHIHHTFDFFIVGTLKEVGVKFGKTLDVHIYQKLI